MKLRRWKCHKEVDADEIVEVLALDGGVDLKLAGGMKVRVDQKFGARGWPAAGDYFVVYEDGHMSWSPRVVFEAGYSILPPAAGTVTRYPKKG